MAVQKRRSRFRRLAPALSIPAGLVNFTRAAAIRVSQIVLLALGCLQSDATPAYAAPDNATTAGQSDKTEGICMAAVRTVSARTGVPVSVLTAITLTETGRKSKGGVKPWPWTVNLEGRGFWFTTQAEGEAFVARHHARGARSYDVGCFQINYKWHGQAFASPIAMFDPIANATYAAKFLTELFNEFGDWSKAAGAYHSRTPALSARYRKRFDRYRATALSLDRDGVVSPPIAEIAPAEPLRPAASNRYPLLVATGASGTPGSAFSAQTTRSAGAFLALGRQAGALWDD